MQEVAPLFGRQWPRDARHGKSHQVLYRRLELNRFDQRSPILSRRQHVRSVRAEDSAAYPARVTAQLDEQTSVLAVPDASRTVPTCGDDRLAVPAEGDLSNPFRMSAQ